MSLDHVKRYLREFQDTTQATFSGGEPMLHPELVIAGVNEATTLGIATNLVTNGFWGRDPARSEHWSIRLREAGLNTVTITHDAFHQEFVPTEAVKIAFQALRKAGLHDVRIIGATLVGLEDPNPFDQQTRLIKEDLTRELHISYTAYEGIMCACRPIDQLLQYMHLLPLDELDSGRKCFCEEASGGSRRLEDRYQCNINHQGQIELCTGIMIGDARETPALELMESYNYEEHPLLSALLAKGYLGILELALEKGYQQLEAYASKCHVCFDARRFLRPLYPDVLTPYHVYEEWERNQSQ